MQNELVIITGASSGIGKHLAENLSEYSVAACVRNHKDKYKNSVLLDVSSDESVSSALRELEPRLRSAAKVHLINNAGIAVSGPVEGVPLARWKEQFEVNVFGLLRATQAFLPYIRETKGKVINISSISGLFVSPYLGAYCASKFSVEAISDALRREMKEFGVDVVLIEPGPVETPIWEKNFSHAEEQIAMIKPELQKIYDKNMRKFLRMAKKSSESAVPASKVTELVLSALKNPHPKARYLVGKPKMGLEILFAKALPSKWMDNLIAKQFR